MIRLTLCPVVLCLCCFLRGQWAIAQEAIFRTEVFATDTVEGIPYKYRIPTMIASRRGTLLAFAERRNGLEDHSQNDIVLKKSFDQGRSWSTLQVVADFGQNSLTDPMAVSLRSGRILLIFAEYPAGIHTRNFAGTQIADNGYDGPRNTRSYLIYSDDDGVSWSAPRDITRSIRPSDRIAVGHPGIGIQLERGPHRGRVVLPLYHTKKLANEETIWTNAVAWSDDEGESWQLSPDIPEKEQVGHGNEAQVVERTDGSLLFIARNQGGFHRKKSVSTDGGFSWTNIRLDFGLPGNPCQGSLLRYSWPEAGENLVLFAAPAYKYARQQGTLRISTDDGASWSFSRQLTPGFFGYSALARLNTAEVGLLYEADNYEKLVFNAFPIDWIKAGDPPPNPQPYLSIPLLDLDQDKDRQLVVDREAGRYLGPPAAILSDDLKTIQLVYSHGDTINGFYYKTGKKQGKRWSKRLPTPGSWNLPGGLPTLYRTVDKYGTRRMILWSGHYPAKRAISADDGRSWSQLESVGNWGGQLLMASMIKLEPGTGRYMAFFHDDQRYFTEKGSEHYAKDAEQYSDHMVTLYKSYTEDGGLTWTEPEVVNRSREMHMTEPCVIRSMDGKQLAVLLNDQSRRENSLVIFSDNEGKNWTRPHALPNELTGERHVAAYTLDGRLLILFRDRSSEVGKRAVSNGQAGSPTEGDWVAWVGTYEDIAGAREDKPGNGQYRIRLKHNTKEVDGGYSSLVRLPNGAFVAIAGGHWTAGESPYLLSVRFKLSELDDLLKKQSLQTTNEPR